MGELRRQMGTMDDRDARTRLAEGQDEPPAAPSVASLSVAGPVTSSTVKTKAELAVADTGALTTIMGARGDQLRQIARAYGVEAGVRGNVIHIAGNQRDVGAAERFLTDLADVIAAGTELSPHDVARAIATLREHPGATLREIFEDVILIPARHKPITAKSVAQKRYLSAIRSHDLTFGIGPAGTGKTYLAMAMAVQALLERRIKRIILCRPAVEAGEKLGFLPGDLAEKVNPYLRPLYDALYDMMDADKAGGLVTRGLIEVAPLAFMRGRTLNDSFVILDEAQNTTSDQMRMFLTRLGYSSKAVVTGDVTQVDLPSGQRSGLAEARELLQDIEGIAFSTFTEVDVVRHPLVQRIIVAYDRRDQALRARDATKDNASRERGRT